MSPRFADNLGTIEGVGVYGPVDVLARADAFVVVGEAIGNLPTVHGHFHELTAAPLHGVAVVGQRVANGVVDSSWERIERRSVPTSFGALFERLFPFDADKSKPGQSY